MSLKQKITPWRNLLGAALLLMVSLGLNVSGMALFYVPVTESLQFSQAQFSLYFTLTTIVCAITTPFAGKIIAKFRESLRILLLICLLTNAVCLFLYSRCNNLYQFYCLSIIRGIAFALDSGIPSTLIANDWFEDRRTMALSLVFVGSTIGGVLFNSVSHYFIDTYGWRTAYSALGVIAVVVSVIIFLLITKTPSGMGLQPYRTKRAQKQAAVSMANDGFTFRQALKRPELWMICIAQLMINITSLAILQNVANSLVLEHGHTSGFATIAVNLIQMGCVVGMLGQGWILDRIGFVKSVFGLCIMVSLSMIGMLWSEISIMAIVAVILFGIGNSITGPLSSSLVSDVFGLKHYSSIYGLISTFMMIGMSTGPFIAASIYDKFGSYDLVWYISMVVEFLFIPLSLIPYIRRHNGKMVPPKNDSSNDGTSHTISGVEKNVTH